MSSHRKSLALHPQDLAPSSNLSTYLVARLAQMLVLEHYRRLSCLGSYLTISFTWKRRAALSCQSWLHSIVRRSRSWYRTSWIWLDLFLLTEDCISHYASSFPAGHKASMLGPWRSVWNQRRAGSRSSTAHRGPWSKYASPWTSRWSWPTLNIRTFGLSTSGCSLYFDFPCIFLFYYLIIKRIYSQYLK